MLLPLMLLALAQDADRVDAIVLKSRELTRADVRCRATDDDDEEIVVCSRREADRYRVPLVLSGNAKNSVPLRTAELTRDQSRLPCGQGAIIAQCGPGFGAGMTVGNGRRVQMVEREKAP